MEQGMRKVLDHPLITEALFYPARISEAQVPEMEHGRIVYIPAGSHRLGAYWYAPFEHAPFVLFFHGNGEIMIDYLFDFHVRMEELGLNFMVVDYQGYGLSTGSPSLSCLLEDARAAWAHLPCLGLSPERVIVMGRSLGSLAALEICSGPGRDAKALIIESGIGRFDHWIDRMAPLLERLGLDVTELKHALFQAFNHEQKIKSFPGPMLVMHAPHDEIVPVQHGRDLASWGGDRATYHEFSRGGHNDIQLLNKHEYFQVLESFLKKSL